MSRVNPWKRLSSKIVYQNPWIKVHEDKVITPDQKEGIYAYLESRDSVFVIAEDDNGRVLLINTYSYPQSSRHWELPGGGGDNQEPARAARRELQEETGITAFDWRLLGKTQVCSGLLTEQMYTYLATVLAFSDNLTSYDKAVITDKKFFSIKEINKMILDKKIIDGQTLAALYLYKLYLTS